MDLLILDIPFTPHDMTVGINPTYAIALYELQKI